MALKRVAFAVGRKRGREEGTTLEETKLITFTKRVTDLEYLQVYDCNVETPVGDEKWFAVREEYDLIYEKFKIVAKNGKKRERCLLILGNSGIGKSIGLDDLLRRVLDSDDGFGFHVLVVVAGRSDYILFRKSINASWTAYSCKHKDTRHSVDALLEQVAGSDEQKKVLLLHDVKGTDWQELRFDAGFATHLRGTFHTTVVVASPPKDANYRSVEDEFAGRTNFWSVCWTADEAKDLWALNGKDTTAFDEAFFNMGGVPRHFLMDTSEGFLNDAENKMANLSYEELHKALKSDSSPCIAMAVPSKDRTYAPLRLCTFVSKGVELLWYRKGKPVNVQAIRDQYNKCVDD